MVLALAFMGVEFFYYYVNFVNLYMCIIFYYAHGTFRSRVFTSWFVVVGGNEYLQF